MVGVIMHITIEIDGDAKALYFRLREGDISETIEYPEGKEVFLDLDERGQVLAIEVLEPAGIDMRATFRKLAERYGIEELGSLVDKSIIELAA